MIKNRNKKECEYCGDIFKCKPSHYDRRKCCSQECSYANRRKKVEYVCEHCESVFKDVPSREKYGRAKHCSKSCQYESNRQKLKSNDREEFECLNCEKRFELAPSQIEDKQGAGKYCSRECRDIHRRGQNHPQYIDGIASDIYGSNWQAQRRSARKRDNYTCQHCGAKKEVLDVHHIKPRRWFDNLKNANKLSNLITLCKPCHRKADAKIQEKEGNNEETKD